jgi:CheY-like chemotaxis protein
MVPMLAVRPYSILITDDDRRSRETLREIVEPAGFRTLLAESGEEALDILTGHEVHVALFDVHLPKMTGIEAMELARQIRGALPTILMTGDQDDELLRKALSAQAFCVLSKPVSRHVVIHVVHRVLTKFYDATAEAPATRPAPCDPPAAG